MQRRRFMAFAGFLACSSFLPAASLPALEVADLQSQLEKGLEVRRPEDFAFIARVVLLVENKTLPRSLVQSTFFWARTKRPYPFVYFQRALRVRAGEIGVTI